ncbi:restriction endonuclease subunit S [Helicobacter pametensis]|uniref:restriction endonuclease subunit S n=1 Tax=Helicobacter pametensis TaxID=95149 RepID=UPI0004B1067B|nr:restriction endonuclease subunit S [Helicobacter pametensis]
MTLPKGYKHTEIGILPSDWQVVRLGEVAKFFSGGTPKTIERKYYGGEIPFIKSAEIYNSTTQETLTSLGVKESSAKWVERGDLLFALYGANSGEVAIAKINGVINQAVLCIKNKPEILNTYFLYSVFLERKEWITTRFLQGGQGNLSGKIVQNLQIPLPPLAEQEKIAEILSTWDTQIQNYESLIAEKQNLKKGLCQTLLTAKTRFKGFSEDWQVVRLGDVAEDEDFKRIPVSSTERERLVRDSDAVYPYYGAMGQVGWINDYIFDEERILLAEDGCPFLEKDKQKSFIAKGKYWVNNHAHILRVDLSKGNNYFLCSQLNRVDYSKYINGAERLKLNKEVMKEIKIPIPSLAEQEKIAEILSEADKQISLLEQKLESLKSQKKGLMQNLLNGKVRV